MMRTCRPEEKCIKMKGTLIEGPHEEKEIIIRDCYPISFFPSEGYVTDLVIDYEGHRLEGFLHVCDRNYCNDGDAGHFSLSVLIISVLLTFMYSYLWK